MMESPLDVVNFAHGTFAMLGAYAVFVAVSLSGSFAVGLVSAVIIVGLIGVAIELFLLKPLYGKDPLLPLLLTFGLSVAIPDVVKIVFGLTGKPVDYPETFGGATIVGPLILSNYRLFIIVFTLAILLSLWFFLKKSDLGMIIRAATRDSLMVQILGTNTSGIWTIGGSDRRPDAGRDARHGGGDDHGGVRSDGRRRPGEPRRRHRRGIADRGHRRLHVADRR
jgi:branched-chain amino acid transport system permease protein